MQEKVALINAPNNRKWEYILSYNFTNSDHLKKNFIFANFSG